MVSEDSTIFGRTEIWQGNRPEGVQGIRVLRSS
jgi:hypothetical protein